MPELPEVETIRMQLEKAVVGKTVADIVSRHPKTVSGDTDAVKGKKITGVSRYGKMLTLDLERKLHIGIHLKMSGQLIYSPLYSRSGNPEMPGRHTRAVVIFTSGDKLYFNDQRIFGWVKVMDDQTLSKMPYKKRLGPEPWDINADDFFSKLAKRKKAVKLVLTDQEIISGVGNIYANDALWEARIHPKRIAKTLTREESDRLLSSVITVLREAIRYQGSSGKDQQYVMIDGSSGSYQEHFRVYDRQGKSCRRNDGGIVEKIMLGGRGTYYCPVCQK